MIDLDALYVHTVLQKTGTFIPQKLEKVLTIASDSMVHSTFFAWIFFMFNNIQLQHIIVITEQQQHLEGK